MSSEERGVLRITRRTWLLVASILVVTLTLVLLAVYVAPNQLAGSLTDEALEELSEAARFEARGRRLQTQNAIRTSLLQAIGGVVLALGLAATWVTVLINRQGQITERFTRAVDQLGHETSVDIRLGGIYALQRIAQESEADRPAIVNVLAAFVRGHNPTRGTRHDPASETAEDDPPIFPDVSYAPVLIKAPDVHEAAVAVGRLRRSGERLFLPRAYLNAAELRGANLQAANLLMADLRFAQLGNADFRGALLQDADLQGVDLNGAKMQGANLQGAYLREAKMEGADLQAANLQSANLQAANLQGADLQGTDLCGASMQAAKMQYANLQAANLQAANLQSAKMQYADLQGADLQGADLRGANLQGARLEGANIRAAKLQDADLLRARGNSHTQWSEGFSYRDRGVIEKTGQDST